MVMKCYFSLRIIVIWMQLSSFGPMRKVLFPAKTMKWLCSLLKHYFESEEKKLKLKYLILQWSMEEEGGGGGGGVGNPLTGFSGFSWEWEEFLGPLHTSCCCSAEPIRIRCGTSTALSVFDSYVEPNLSNLITNQAKLSFISKKWTVVIEGKIQFCLIFQIKKSTAMNLCF